MLRCIFITSEYLTFPGNVSFFGRDLIACQRKWLLAQLDLSILTYSCTHFFIHLFIHILMVHLFDIYLALVKENTVVVCKLDVN